LADNSKPLIGENEEYFFDLAEHQNRKSIAMNNKVLAA
jgi:hypothetical protein